ncbi:MAG: electron transport complex subunit RsxC [Acidobacteriota bacterium]|nr:electron transport complex subunit RsxC [Acidobacteriota bacterium]
MSDLTISRRATFKHGIHPDELKQATNALPIERMPFVKEYVLPLSMHIGAPSRPLVEVGQRVERGECIAAAEGYISTASHAPVTGTVSAIEPRPHPSGARLPAIVIRTDLFSSQRLGERIHPLPGGLSAAELIGQVQAAGLVGLGGAAFPSHVKLQVPEGKRAKFVILNGCECEPYLTCDHRLMLERAEAVLHGLTIIREMVGAERSYIGVENNKPDAIAALRRAGADDPGLTIVPLEVKYPQGAEKMLIDAIFALEIPSGRLPLDLEMLVNNVGTAAALSDLVRTGLPLIERVVTVSGTGIRRPANVLVPIGTPLKDLVEYCGGLLPRVRQVILGGPMMGQAQKNLDVPVVKGSSGVLVFTHAVPVIEEQPCIRCGRCLEACAMFLNPSRLALMVRADDVEGLKQYNMPDCFECAACSYTCPSSIPLVQLMRVGKAMVRQDKS